MNLMYVDDAIDNILNVLAMNVSGYNPYCLWNEEYVTVKELVSVIQNVFNTELLVEWGAKEYSGHEMFSPWHRPFKQLPNMLSQTTLEDGLRRTYESQTKAIAEN
jgi:nucleoside-diphosphate-sugar epimerase